jgi:hypothetical protein
VTEDHLITNEILARQIKNVKETNSKVAEMKTVAVQMLEDMDWMLVNDKQAEANANADVSTKEGQAEIKRIRNQAKKSVKENYMKILKAKEQMER